MTSASYPCSGGCVSAGAPSTQADLCKTTASCPTSIEQLQIILLSHAAASTAAHLPGQWCWAKPHW